MDYDFLAYSSIFIEFEIKNIDDIPYANEREIIETIKELGCLAPFNSPKRILFPSQNIGTFLLEIINSCNSIKKIILCNYMKLSSKIKETGKRKDKILKNKFKGDYNSYITERNKLEENLIDKCCTILEKLLHELEHQYPKLSIFHHCAYDYIKKYHHYYQVELDNLRDAFTKLRREIESGSERFMSHYLLVEKQMQEKDNIEYFFYRLSEGVANFVGDFLNGKQLIENAFIHSEGTRNNKFSGSISKLPSANIYYKLDGFKCATPYKYIYAIETIQDLFNVTIYQLSLNHKVIIKCKNCGKYLIPDRTDRQYCINTNCKNRYMSRKSMENSSMAYQQYRTLYNRYKNTKTYKKDFEELKKIYYNQYKTKQIDDETFMTILLDFEEKVKSTYNLQRGRPKKKQNM